MNLNQRLQKLEQARDADNQTGPVILVADMDDEGADAAIERWKVENGPAPDDAFFIVLVALK